MKPRLSRERNHALTLIEVVVIVVVVMVLIFLFLPHYEHHRVSYTRIKCENNLKQIGLSFLVWSDDNNGDKYPMQLSVTNGDLIEPAFAPTPASIFQVLSNVLNDPKVLVCPADTNRSTATNFVSKLLNYQVSYFVGLDAVEIEPGGLLSGDHNITNGVRTHYGILELTTNQPAGWTDEIHNGNGNVVLADGSVQQLTTIKLRQALQETGLATNRLAMP